MDKNALLVWMIFGGLAIGLIGVIIIQIYCGGACWS